MTPRRKDSVRAGDVVYVTYDELVNTPALVRKVIDRREGILSVRILLDDIPEERQIHWIPDPHNPEFTPLVVKDDEWQLARI